MTTSRRTARWLTLALAALIAGCAGSGAPPSGALPGYAGTVQSSCSPVDATALALDLEAESSTDPARLSFLLWPPNDFQRGAVIRLSATSGPTAAAMWAGETEWRLAERGELWVDDVQPEGAARGRFRLDFGSGRRLEGSFRADWIDPGPFYCG